MTEDIGEPETVLPIFEETLVVGRRVVPTGRVRVSTVTEKVDAVLDALVATSEIEVTRVPVGREIDAMPDVRTEGDVTIVPVVEEVPVITTRLFLREEIHLKRVRGEKTIQIPVELLKQRASITREALSTEKRTDTMADTTYTTDASGRTLTAFFDSRTDAEEAVSRLKAIGLSDSNVRLTGGGDYEGRAYSDTDKGFWDSISDFFFPPEDQATYAEGLRRGGYLVTVTSIPEAHYDKVLDILDDEGSVDIDERAESWRAEGWSGTTAAAGGVGYGATSEPGMLDAREAASDTAQQVYGADAVGDVTATGAGTARVDRTTEVGDDEAIPVIRESLRVGKRDVNVGRVRVRSYMVEEPVREDVTLREERVEIERRPVDRALGAGDEAFVDRTIEAQEHAEEAVVSKDARVVEEIALRKRADERTETISDTVRHTEVEVEDERTGLTDADKTGLNDPTTRR